MAKITNFQVTILNDQDYLEDKFFKAFHIIQKSELRSKLLDF